MAEAIDKLIAAMAAKQWGYVTRRQLLAIGLGPGAIEYRVRTGGLIPVHTGVYAVGHVPIGPIPGAFAAVLACGKNAALSHGSAATLWGFNKYWDMPLEVTVGSSHRRRNGITIHRSRTLTWRDMTKQLGVPVTTPARTVLDITPRLTDRRLTRVINDGRRAGHVHLAALGDVLDRNPNHPGTKRLRLLVAHAPRNPTRSPLEDDFLAFARRFGLPEPVTNSSLFGYEIDVLYPAEKVIVELDGYEFHRDRATFRRDLKRDAIMLAKDYLTVRITDDRMEHDAEREADRLLTILEQRRAA
jgi:Transcriptional regulator, AbiEi antitoxin/Protein of unknown function (DUF559)